jgi:hypothetical protein
LGWIIIIHAAGVVDMKSEEEIRARIRALETYVMTRDTQLARDIQISIFSLKWVLDI